MAHHKIDLSSHQGDIVASPGDRVSFSVAGNPTTGWTETLVGEGSDGLKQVGSHYGADREGLIGGGGVYAFEYEVAAPGTHQLHFQYARGWEKDTPPAREHHVTIVADGAAPAAE